MTLSRRELLRQASALGVVTVIPAAGCSSGDGDGGGSGGSGGTGGDGLPTYSYDGDPGPENLFEYGVASGDPLADAVILWSRVSPAEEGTVEVFFEMARDVEFDDRVAADFLQTSADRDYTVKVDVTGLDSGTTYYYRFLSLGRQSPVGRTRTAPEGDVTQLRFGVCSCSSLAHGWFHAYKHMAARADLDAVLHLGDYIYEYGNDAERYGDVRDYEPDNEIVTLADYRERYAQYRREPELRELHRQHPMVAVWDDHETTNNAYADGAENHQPDEGDYGERKSVSAQAYSEWLPIRDDADLGKIWRTLRYGNLVDLIMLDTRRWGRDEQANFGDLMTAEDPNRSILGSDQETWFADQLRTSTARWKVVVQQVMLAHLGPVPINTDQWDGYLESRRKFFRTVVDNQIDNVVVLTGDIHMSWACDVSEAPYDAAVYDEATGSGSIAVEFVTPGITSPGLNGDSVGAVRDNPHVKFNDQSLNGYLVLDITAARANATWYYVGDVASQTDTGEQMGAAFEALDGSNRVTEGSPSTEKADPPSLAP